MDICHAHNLDSDPTTPMRYGISLRLPAGDSFTRLLGKDWETTHWYKTAAERDRALRDMRSEHRYSRRGDRPTVLYEVLERPDQD